MVLMDEGLLPFELSNAEYAPLDASRARSGLYTESDARRIGQCGFNATRIWGGPHPQSDNTFLPPCHTACWQP
jgi:hypothetical protein